MMIDQPTDPVIIDCVPPVIPGSELHRVIWAWFHRQERSRRQQRPIPATASDNVWDEAA